MIQNIHTGRSRYRLEVGRVVLDLYIVVIMIASGSVFCETSMTLSIYGERIGKRAFTTLDLVTIASEYTINTTSKYLDLQAIEASTASRGVSAQNKPLSAESEVLDPNCYGLQVTWRFKEHTVPKHGVLSAIT